MSGPFRFAELVLVAGQVAPRQVLVSGNGCRLHFVATGQDIALPVWKSTAKWCRSRNRMGKGAGADR